MDGEKQKKNSILYDDISENIYNFLNIQKSEQK